MHELKTPIKEVGAYHDVSSPHKTKKNNMEEKETSEHLQTMLYQRKSPRADFHDYSKGDYFITICTRDKEHFFGQIVNGQFKFTEIGAFANKTLSEIPIHHAYAEIPVYVVMPNHVHAIIRINEQEKTSKPMPEKRTVLGVVIGGYKQAVTSFARRNNIVFGWQSRYHDHIIRDSYDEKRITEYIENNVANWDKDCFYL